MENKKGGEPKKRAETDPSKILKAAEQMKLYIIETARKEANDEAIKILKEVEQKGRHIINEAIRTAKAEADKIVAQAEDKARHIEEEAKAEKPRAEQEGLLIIEAARKTAQTEAATIVAQAQEKARQIIDEAKSRTQAEVRTSRPFRESPVEERSLIDDAKRKTEAEASKVAARAEEKTRQIIDEAQREGVEKVIADTSISEITRRARQIIEAEKIAASQPSQKPQQVGKASAEKPTIKAKGQKQTIRSYKEADLVMLPPVNFSQLERLRISLQQLRNIRSLTMVGTSDGGTSISVELHRPANLIEDLKKIDSVEEAIEEESLDSHPLGELVKKAAPPRSSKRTREQRILIVLKKSK